MATEQIKEPVRCEWNAARLRQERNRRRYETMFCSFAVFHGYNAECLALEPNFRWDSNR